jgi:hypothetical protein
MALADPQTITIDTVEKTLNRIKSDGFKSIYATADEEVKLTISHQESKGRTRRMARIDVRTIAADPLTSENEYKVLGFYVVFDEPEYGFEDDEIYDVVLGFQTWLTETMVGKICGNQH